MILTEANIKPLFDILPSLIVEEPKRLPKVPKLFTIADDKGVERDSPNLDRFYFYLFVKSMKHKEETPFPKVSLSPAGCLDINTRDLAKHLQIKHENVFPIYKFLVNRFDDHMMMNRNDSGEFILSYVNRLYEAYLGVRKHDYYEPRDKSERLIYHDFVGSYAIPTEEQKEDM